RRTEPGSGPRTDLFPRTARMFTALLTGTLALAACDSAGDPASPEQAEEVRILGASQATVVVGGTVRLEAAGFAAGGRALGGLVFEWQSLDPAVAEVDGAGLVTGVAVGEARVVASLGE